MRIFRPLALTGAVCGTGSREASIWREGICPRGSIAAQDAGRG